MKLPPTHKGPPASLPESALDRRTQIRGMKSDEPELLKFSNKKAAKSSRKCSSGYCQRGTQ